MRVDEVSEPYSISSSPPNLTHPFTSRGTDEPSVPIVITESSAIYSEHSLVIGIDKENLTSGKAHREVAGDLELRAAEVQSRVENNFWR